MSGPEGSTEAEEPPGVGKSYKTIGQRSRAVKRILAVMIGVATIGVAAGAGPAHGQSPPSRSDPKLGASAEPKRVPAQSASGAVKAAGADSLVISGKAKGGKETEWTFTVVPATKVRKAGKDIRVTELAAGDPVLVRYHEHDGKNVADVVMVRAARKSTASGGTASSGADAAKK
jgi:hypothetical protein